MNLCNKNGKKGASSYVSNGPKMDSFFDLDFHDLESLLKVKGFNTRGASQVFNHIYKKRKFAFDIPNLAGETISYLKGNFAFSLPMSDFTKSQAVAQGEVYKFLFRFKDGLRAEAVLIPFQKKYTLCLSSQVGCAMGCTFCFTGTQGLSRHLTSGEIVGQVLKAMEHVDEINEASDGEAWRLSNLVFMGQGEPLHNFENVFKACSNLLDQHGLSFGRDKITISTVGYLPGLKKWKDSHLPVNLALSLHSAKEEIRSQIIPMNKSHPLNKVLNLIKEIPLARKQFVTIEVLLIKDVNDTREDALALIEKVKELKCLVNIIPFNPFPGNDFARPEDRNIELFKAVVEETGIPTMVRKTKGDAILAACGQLTS